MGKYKRTIFWIIPIAILGVFIYFFGPKKPVTDNEYVQYIQATPVVENSNITTEVALKNYCEKSKWEYFQTKMMEHVVEFKGDCKVNDKVQSVNLQYVVEKGQANYRIGAMLVAGIQQTEEQRSAFLNTVNQ
ncbi:glucosamine 6-phosphate synthetase [Solibacillus daqui]|uniref:glucosamine 6-phosphate synthetase n=1 Tax=Solibacillus daqui TaxID=2912187 RepID=UPI0023656BD4|nr:glucosamine 6-phosphate synthetase [Solibacillus daqui]